MKTPTFMFVIVALGIWVMSNGCNGRVHHKSDGTFNLQSHAIFVQSTNELWHIVLFERENMMIEYYPDGSSIHHYIVNGDWVMRDGKEWIEVKDGEIVTVNADFDDNDYTLIKLPETNQLQGKAFAGQYLDENGDVIHTGFFYSFDKVNTHVNAGCEVGVPERMEDYELIGNVAARVQKADYWELLVYVDGKLAANCLFQEGENHFIYHGILPAQDGRGML